MNCPTSRSTGSLINSAPGEPCVMLGVKQQDARDLEIINRRADHLNQEAMDVLTYQVDL